ncbi:MAG: hypothetical protein HXJ92_03250 [candidate division SR1 bacterium]|nr:hypothetical protein [candidate division SR1 bacterium]
MRNQLTNPRGNIILLALFVLFASSLIGLLISMMMRGFLRYSEDIASYQKASYLAKAGAEVGFLLTNTTKANFDYTLEKGDKENILNNFTCKRGKEENGICPDFNLNLEITGLGKSLNNCSKDKLTLSGGQSIIIPAFYATEVGLGGNQMGQVKISTIAIEGDSNSLKKTIATYDQNNTLTLKEWEGEKTSNTNSYFILSNTGQAAVQICPSGENIPQENIKILSTATFRDKTIGKEYLSTQKLPDFLKSDNYLATKQNN